MKVGFIGLGNLGGPMCRKIIKNSGQEVVVFDLNADAVKACTDVGAKAAGSVAELAAECEVILTSLPMPKDVEQVALGPGGIGEHAKPGTCVFELSTNSPKVVKHVAEELKAKDIILLDAPVSGGVIAVEKETLAVMVGGDKAMLEKHKSILECFGGNIIYAGALGNGCVAKLVNNLVSFCNMAAGAEGLMLGVMAGIDVETLNQVIRNSSGNSIGYRYMAVKSISGDYTPTFALDLGYKDLHLALELADELGTPMSIAPQVHNLMRMARGLGHGQEDITAMMRAYEDVLGRTVKP